MSTKKLKKSKKDPLRRSRDEAIASRDRHKKQAHDFMCHGFISQVEYKKVLDRIAEWYIPIISVIEKTIKERSKNTTKQKVSGNCPECGALLEEGFNEGDISCPNPVCSHCEIK